MMAAPAGGSRRTTAREEGFTGAPFRPISGPRSAAQPGDLPSRRRAEFSVPDAPGWFLSPSWASSSFNPHRGVMRTLDPKRHQSERSHRVGVRSSPSRPESPSSWGGSVPGRTIGGPPSAGNTRDALEVALSRLRGARRFRARRVQT
jgi:hypothetical protein